MHKLLQCIIIISPLFVQVKIIFDYAMALILNKVCQWENKAQPHTEGRVSSQTLYLNLKAPDANSIQLNLLVTVYNNHTGLYINYRKKHWLLLGGCGLNFLEDSQGTFKLWNLSQTKAALNFPREM